MKTQVLLEIEANSEEEVIKLLHSWDLSYRDNILALQVNPSCKRDLHSMVNEHPELALRLKAIDLILQSSEGISVNEWDKEIRYNKGN